MSHLNLSQPLGSAAVTAVLAANVRRRAIAAGRIRIMTDSQPLRRAAARRLDTGNNRSEGGTVIPCDRRAYDANDLILMGVRCDRDSPIAPVASASPANGASPARPRFIRS